MPSSTSSSEPPVNTAVPIDGRPVPQTALSLAAIVATIVTLLAIAGWEWQWREFGATPSYKNSDGLWAMQRRRLDDGEGDQTAIVGSSRIFFDLQLPVWERLAGARPIQLALEGTSPLGAMEQLADDEDFTGTLLVGVSPGLFFSGFAYRGEVFQHYFDETPSQRWGQRISMWLEPWFAFYQPDFALFTVLERQAWPERDGVRTRLDVRKLANFTSDRNARLWEKVETDEPYRELARKVWMQNFVPPDARGPEFAERMLAGRAAQIERAAAAVAKLRERGVDVIFVRPPSDGPFLEHEQLTNPRAETWDVLLERTGAPGIHYADHESLQGGWLPEWSHLAGEDADEFTAALYPLVQAALDADVD